jgi:hypothetical protein
MTSILSMVIRQIIMTLISEDMVDNTPAILHHVLFLQYMSNSMYLNEKIFNISTLSDDVQT